MHKRYIIVILGLLAFGAGGMFAWQKHGGRDGNRLKDEISPYLLLHAHNPVDWYPWGEEALQRARREQKPIFLSVGYSTCYWCHVMERQVFSNPDIAAIMNEHFINIKVDREERPDLDEVYMTATQLMTGSGGWPNSVFLTPDLKPFYGGTYFPPEDLPGRPAFPKLAFSMSQTFQNERAKAEEYAERVTKAIRAIQAEAFVPDDSVGIDRVLVNRAVDRLKSRYDVQNGGFGGAPKFPQPMQLELLLSDYERTGDVRILPIVTHTLDAMARGGMYDHVGGGFHRYATDVRWRVPHFEKMLYNQSDLSRIYLMAYRITGKAFYVHVAEDILAYVTRDMLGDDGAFYSAMDSETDAVEGQYYLWSDAEIKEVLGDDAELFLWVYGLTAMPEGEGGVLYKASAVDTVAFEIGMAP
ncbi:MAG: thioredoxin domain-containing protein, partial [Gemmatimonadota bacterium]|nr:thioredoxin domain-containing protein [Gemmatimonadota bacterium]